MSAKSLASGFLFSTLIVLPFFLVVINLGFLFVHLLTLFAVVFVFLLALWGFLTIVFFYKTLSTYNNSTKTPLSRMMWQDGLILAFIIFTVGIVVALRLLPAL